MKKKFYLHAAGLGTDANDKDPTFKAAVLGNIPIPGIATPGGGIAAAIGAFAKLGTAEKDEILAKPGGACKTEISMINIQI